MTVLDRFRLDDKVGGDPDRTGVIIEVIGEADGLP